MIQKLRLSILESSVFELGLCCHDANVFTLCETERNTIILRMRAHQNVSQLSCFVKKNKL